MIRTLSRRAEIVSCLVVALVAAAGCSGSVVVAPGGTSASTNTGSAGAGGTSASTSTGSAGAGGTGGSGGDDGCGTPGQWTSLGSKWDSSLQLGGWTQWAWDDGHLATWNGVDGSLGATYDTTTNTWLSLAPSGAPSPRHYAAVAQAGSRFVVWGGWDASVSVLDDGGIYDLVTHTWMPTAAAGAPPKRRRATAVTAGDRIIVWGGDLDGSGVFLATGGIFDPGANTWTPTSIVKPPGARAWHTAIWTGSRMIVWGGGHMMGALATGGIYDPATDTWTHTSVAGAPAARTAHGAVWTGSRMMVWGGQTSGVWPSTGGLYDPATDTWAPTSTEGAPPGAENPLLLAVDGRVLVVARGAMGEPPVTALYDPATDKWTTVTDAPIDAAFGASLGCKVLLWQAQGWAYRPPAP